MVYHNWGDDDVDWKGIGESARYIATNLKRWGRVGVRDYKEKYGTVRIYLSIGWESLFSVTHPGYVYSRYPKWLWSFCCSKYSRWIFRQINRVVVPYHIFLYRYFYRQAVKKWPHLTEEILCAADFYELLEDLTPRWTMIRVARQVTQKNFESIWNRLDELEEKVRVLEQHAPYKYKERDDEP